MENVRIALMDTSPLISPSAAEWKLSCSSVVLTPISPALASVWSLAEFGMVNVFVAR
jgi:hypothetical protein